MAVEDRIFVAAADRLPVEVEVQGEAAEELEERQEYNVSNVEVHTMQMCAPAIRDDDDKFSTHFILSISLKALFSL